MAQVSPVRAWRHRAGRILKVALQSRLAALRLTLHESSAQVLPTASGIPWLGFVIFPGFRKVKARRARHTTRRLAHRYEAYCSGQITFAEFDASIQGWINHVCFADSWGLRRHVLAPFRLKPGNIGVRLFSLKTDLKNFMAPLRGAQ